MVELGIPGAVFKKRFHRKGTGPPGVEGDGFGREGLCARAAGHIRTLRLITE